MSASPKVLLLETSGRRGLVAVAEGDELLAVRPLDESRRNARDLAPAVAELLRDRGWAAADLGLVIVSQGPGSYTGLRVGVMSAKALAFATGAALVGVETFAAVAAGAPAECQDLEVIADAQKDDVYLQRFVRQPEGGWAPAAPLAIVQFPDWLAGRSPAPWVGGPGLGKVRQRLPAGVTCLPPEACDPGAAALLALGLARYRDGGRDDPFALEPLYLRASSAEEQWQRRP